MVNDCASGALFPHFPPRAIIDGDIESNTENNEDGSLKIYDQLVSIQLPIYNGMRVCFTGNVSRDIDFVNGMGVQAVRVRTDTGRLVPVWPYTDFNMGNVTYYPLRSGYAATTLKYVGTELKHVTLNLDAPNVPGAAYSRMSRTEDFLLRGFLTAEHFVPAR